MAGNPEMPVLFSHPVYHAGRYRLNARSVHWEPEEMPDEAEWQELLTILGYFPASSMIWEDTPLRQIRERLDSAGIRSVVFDPCAGTPPSGDFLQVMEENLQALRLVFAAESVPFAPLRGDPKPKGSLRQGTALDVSAGAPGGVGMLGFPGGEDSMMSPLPRH